MNRRNFFSTAGTAAASSALLSHRMQAGPQAGTSSKKPRMFVGCCAYSYDKYLSKGQMTMEDFFLRAVDMGVDGVDVTTYYLKSRDPKYLANLRRLAFRNGLLFSGAAIGTDMCQPDAAKRAQELEKIKQWLDASQLLGAPHLRVFGGELPKGATEEQGIQWVVETMKPACDYAAKKAITLGIEDHGGITSKASTVLEILRRVDSPFAGFNLDISNFPENEYAQIEASVPYATQTHIRDHFGESHQPIDLDRVFKMFADAGYKGYMSAEYEGEEDPMTAVPKLIARIRTLCKKYSTV